MADDADDPADEVAEPEDKDDTGDSDDTGDTDEVDDGEEEDLDEDDTEVEVPEEVHTVCHLCGGAGMIADPKFAMIGGQARTVDNGRNCPVCDTDGHFAGIIPPL